MPRKSTRSEIRAAAAEPVDLPLLTRLLQFDCAVQKSLDTPAFIIGVDEVGRGSLIGPVTAAAVCFPNPLPADARKRLAALNDSKALPPAVRARLAEEIQSLARVGIGQAEKAEVDALNVHKASLLAAWRACQSLSESAPELDPETAFVLLDGKFRIPELPPDRQRAIVKGDGLSAAIAAASVLAKHTRDSWVLSIASDYPGYGWETNMGYGTPAHLEGLARLGLTPHHRLRFKLTEKFRSECAPLG